ncbi:coiled-coil domain-containing protein 85C-like [Penaeus chinensis]|uniref:coiled-coil domain-containing protein 85C-like n=1 Tax=Penaeus chinensis TaxID=139456 RepID=UPI001FB68B28|nr:coiled-coil domain-containing protein 85C-like [Penaeus chinensis]
MPAAADTHQHLEHHMAYPQHQGKTGPPRPGPHHGPQHHSSHPPSGSYGPQSGHANHVGYNHHGPMGQHAIPGQRGQPGQHGPPQQNGPQINLGQHRSQIGSAAQLGAGQHGHPGPPGPMGPAGQHVPLSSHGSSLLHGPQGNHGPHGVPNQRVPPGSHIQAVPPAIQHKGPAPHGQYGAHIPHSTNIGSTRGHLDGPGNEVRQPPAYPEPPRYPGPQNVHEDMDKHMSQVPTHNGQPAQTIKQYSGAQGSGGGGGMNGGGASMNSGDLGRLEEELSQLSRKDLVARTMRAEGEARELQHSIHVQAGELRHLRENQQRLTDDNQELRDLCCFLDDDRQKGRKLAREWQRFGRYTASVMRQEVTAYQNKLRELDTKQQELIKDNLELKELCLYLDEERNNAACSHCGHPLITRDDGDGSSSSTNADEPSGPPQSTSDSAPTQSQSSEIPLARSSSRERLLEDTLSRQRSPMNEQVMSYIRSLEARVMMLETEKQQLGEELSKMDRIHPEGEGLESQLPTKEKSVGSRPPQPPPYSLSHHLRAVGLGLTNRTPLGPGSAESDDELLDGPPPPLVSRPTAVAAAMRVLEVQEQLEGASHPPAAPPPSQGPPPPPHSSNTGSQLSAQDAALADGEKALLRQMCNVVWKKLEEVPSQHR